MKLTDIYYKAAGTGLLSLSVASLLTYALGIFGNALFPGLFFGVAGLALVNGPQTAPGKLPKETEERLERFDDRRTRIHAAAEQIITS